ncbi:MAG: TfoX/Sxy family protein [Ignavibacteriae bacterium]|nr:TfoX/Sxy family protein [Ignavibacteriota bacterium]
MASDASFVQFVVDQVNGAGAITSRYMFGEYALYCNEKVVGLICDNKLFVKPTDAGRAFIGTPVEAPAYTGAKPSFLIEDKLEDRAWLTELIRITEREVSMPTRKSKNKDATQPAGAKPPAARPATKSSPQNAKKKAATGAKKAPKQSAVKTTKKSSKSTSKNSSKTTSKKTPKKTTKKTPPKKTLKKTPKKTLKKTTTKAGGKIATTTTKKNVKTKKSSRR